MGTRAPPGSTPKMTPAWPVALRAALGLGWRCSRVRGVGGTAVGRIVGSGASLQDPVGRLQGYARSHSRPEGPAPFAGRVIRRSAVRRRDTGSGDGSDAKDAASRPVPPGKAPPGMARLPQLGSETPASAGPPRDGPAPRVLNRSLAACGETRVSAERTPRGFCHRLPAIQASHRRRAGRPGERLSTAHPGVRCQETRTFAHLGDTNFCALGALTRGGVSGR